jgi:hypothetical protein
MIRDVFFNYIVILFHVNFLLINHIFCHVNKINKFQDYTIILFIFII